MKSDTDYLRNLNSLPDGLTYSHNDVSDAYSDARKLRRNGDTPIVSGPHDSDGDKGKSSGSSNSSKNRSKNSSRW